jgi:hypothetical protein
MQDHLHEKLPKWTVDAFVAPWLDDDSGLCRAPRVPACAPILERIRAKTGARLRDRVQPVDDLVGVADEGLIVEDRVQVEAGAGGVDGEEVAEGDPLVDG